MPNGDADIIVFYNCVNDYLFIFSPIRYYSTKFSKMTKSNLQTEKTNHFY